MANQVVTRTYVASIQNQQQVCDELDSLGFAVSKLWNVGRWVCDRVWNGADHIPGKNELTAYLKKHERYADLHSQSSQRVLQQLAEAFKGWYGKRRNGNTKANPPGYKKSGDNHPRSTITFKQRGFKLDTQHNRVRLSKGSNLKEHRSDFVLCSYQLTSVENLSDVDRVRQVRAKWNGNEWELHFVCSVETKERSPGDKTVGIDLGINNFATLAYEDGCAELYPLNCLKEDDYYFNKEIAKCGSSSSEQVTRMNQTKSARREHYLHTLSKHIVSRCVEDNVGEIVIGDLTNIRVDNKTHEPQNWGNKGNLDLHTWPYNKFTKMITYKAEIENITVTKVSERNTSKTCSCCGERNNSNRVERGLYVCSNCEMVANADVNGAENIRQKVTPNLQREDRSNGWLAQPSTYLFDKEQGTFVPQEQIVS